MNCIKKMPSNSIQIIQSIFSVILLLCIVTMLQAENNTINKRQIPVTLPRNPGNIFLEGQKIIINLPDELNWECLDIDRKCILQGNGRIADLGYLSVGYYEIVPYGKKNLGPGELLPWPVTIGVIAPLKAPTPLESPIAVDGAFSGFYGDDDNTKALEIGANQAALAGVNWIRDRVNWRALHLGPEQFSELNEYDHSVRIQSEAGLRVLQVPYSRTPNWVKSDGRSRFPLDLRDAYKYYVGMSTRWKDYVEAWEPWNEPEWVAFGGHTGAEIASLQKACYWAIRKGNPNAKVSLIALTGEYFDHLINFEENGVWPYFDTFNYHQYFNLFEGDYTVQLLRRVAAG